MKMNKGGERMVRTFKETSNFRKKWNALGLTDDDLRVLQLVLLKKPKAGDTISGSGGHRKIRIPVNNMGKSSSCRVIYIDVEIKECIYLVDIYAKSEKENLTEKEINVLKKIAVVLKEE